MPELKNTHLHIVLEERWPRLASVTRLENGASLSGCPSGQPFALELNGRRFGPEGLASRVEIHEQHADYFITVPAVEVSLHFRFELVENEVRFRLPGIEERGDFRVERVYLPEHRLITGTAEQGDSYLRFGTLHTNWSRGWCPGSTMEECEDLGLVADGIPEYGPRPTTHACVWNPGICAAIHSSTFSDPLMTSLEAEGQLLDGRAGRFSMWAGPFPYRLRGTPANPFEVRIAILGDYNGSGQIDWCDAAAWEGDLLLPADRYRETLVYKIFLDDRGRAHPNCTFDECLHIIRQLHEVSGGMKQVAYLVGWQQDGHDAGYPHPQYVNPRLGGEAGLQQLIEAARQYNCVVSLHTNVNDAYTHEPGYQETLLSRDADGTLFPWFNSPLIGDICRSVNLTLAIEAGCVAEWIDSTLQMAPIQETIHLDAFRQWGEVWLPDGTHIDAECEFQRGMQPIHRLLAERGLDVTTEGFIPGISGWAWILPDWRRSYLTVLTHGRMGGFYRITGGFHRNRETEGDALGNGFVWNETAVDDYTNLLDNFYLVWMYDQILRREKMIDYQVGEWQHTVHARYSHDTWVRCGWTRSELQAQHRGMPIARGNDRFLPWREDTIFAYSQSGGAQCWELPEAWQDAQIEAVVLRRGGGTSPLPFECEGRTLRFQLPARVPGRFRRAAEA